MFLVSAVQVLRLREWQRPLIAFAGSAIVFQILTLVQPHVLVGMGLVAALALLWRRPHHGAIQTAGQRAIIAT
jgi:hypothetical protein